MIYKYDDIYKLCSWGYFLELMHNSCLMFINDLFALPEIGTEKYKSHDMFKLFISSQSTVTISQFPTVIRILLHALNITLDVWITGSGSKNICLIENGWKGMILEKNGNSEGNSGGSFKYQRKRLMYIKWVFIYIAVKQKQVIQA